MSEQINLMPANNNQKGNNPVAYIAFVLCIVFLLFPFFTTYQVRKSGEIKNIGLYSDCLESSFDGNIRGSKYWAGDVRTSFNIFKYCTYTCMFLFFVASFLFLVSISFLIKSKPKAYWFLIQGCSLCSNIAIIAYFIGMVALSSDLDYIDAFHSYYSSSDKLRPAPFFYVALAGSLIAIIISDEMLHLIIKSNKKKEKEKDI